tara:strand:+ start:36 stop:476 length:441 start_codon:yes stop_codon:yes gene_type:complete
MLFYHEKQVNEPCRLAFRQSRLMEQGCGWEFFESYFHACSHNYSSDLKKTCSVSGGYCPVTVIDVKGIPYHGVFTLSALDFAASSKASLTAGVDPCILFWLPLRARCPFCLSPLPFHLGRGKFPAIVKIRFHEVIGGHVNLRRCET